MPHLRLRTLHCHQTEDFTGADEPYLRVQGAVVWGPSSLNNGQVANLSPVALIPFFGLATIELFDQDTDGIFDPDDFLGALTASHAQAGQGAQSGQFTGDGASYTLVYEVLP